MEQVRSNRSSSTRLGLYSCMVVAEVSDRERRGRHRHYNPRLIAGLRPTADPGKREDAFRKQFKKRGLPTDVTKKPRVTGAQILETYRREDIERGKLALKLERLLLALCTKAENGPAFVSARELADIEKYEASELNRLIQDLAGNGTQTSGWDAARLTGLAGPGLMRAWKLVFGERGRLRRRSREEIGAQSSANIDSGIVESTKTCELKRKSNSNQVGNLNKTASQRGITKAVRRFSLAAVCAFAFSATGYFAFDPDARAYEIFKKKGSREALSYIRNLKHGSDYAYYLHAFGLYQENNLKEAEAALKKLAFGDSNNPYIQSDTYYLMGLISSARGDIEISIGYFLEGIKVGGKDKSREFLIMLEIAKSYIQISELSKAKIYLEKASALKNHASNLYGLFEAESALEFEVGNVQQALEIALWANDLDLKGSQKFYSLNRLSFIYCRLGDLEKALLYLDRAESYAADKRQKTLLKISRVAARTCKGLTTLVLEEEVAEWLSKHPEPLIKKHFSEAKSCLALSTEI